MRLQMKGLSAFSTAIVRYLAVVFRGIYPEFGLRTICKNR